jgi:hypothetical protein
MLDVEKTHPIFSLMQKIFSQVWNAGLIENVDVLRADPFGVLKKNRNTKAAEIRQKLKATLKQSPSNTHLQFKTSDDLLLDGMVFNKGKEKMILFVPGVGSFYEKIGQKKSVISGLYSFFQNYFPDHSVFVFNNRGIGESQGTFDLKTLPLDTVGAYDYLMKTLGYDLNSILLYTHSLGGLHATIGAGMIQQRFPEAKISAINDRSFADLAIFTKAFFKGSALGGFGKGVIDKLKANISAETAWDHLQGKKIIIVSEHDKVIPYKEASFFHNVRCETIIHLEGSEDEADHHTRPFYPNEAKMISSIILS